MALSEDQRAMLQLLLERGQSYEDIGSLLGLDTDEVRARARASLTEMGGEDPDKDVGLTDYLLGQADPIGRADAVRHLGADQDAHALAAKLIAQLKLIAPAAELPELPAGRGGVRPAAGGESAPAASAAPAPPAEAAGPGFFASLSRGQRQLIAALVAGGIVALVGVLALTGAFSGGDSNESNGGQAQSTTAQNVTRAILQPPNGGSARGVAIFGRVRNQPVLQVAIAGLDPSPKGRSYVVWLTGPKAAFPLSRETAGKRGTINGLAPLPTQLIAFLQRGTFDSVEVSLANDADVEGALRTAQQQTNFPKYVGQTALTGSIVGPGFGTPTNTGGGGGAGGGSGG
jgi:hypothetical protein